MTCALCGQLKDLTNSFECGIKEGGYDDPSDYELKKNKYDDHMYFNNPEAIAEIVSVIISLHDECKVNEFKLKHTWYDLGLDEFSKRDVIQSVEQEFDFEFTDQEIEQFRNLGDLVEHLSKSSYIH